VKLSSAATAAKASRRSEAKRAIGEGYHGDERF
jgi:hypothetical protein